MMDKHRSWIVVPGLVAVGLLAACNRDTISPDPPNFTTCFDKPQDCQGGHPNFRMTGGGRIDDPQGLQKNSYFEPGVCDGKSFATFGFTVGPVGSQWHEMQWVDHCRGWRIHMYAVDSYETLSGSGNVKERGCAAWSGPARFNGVDGYRWRVLTACDEGEPGWRDPNDPNDPPDWINVELSLNGTVLYLRGGNLTGGNIQTHPLKS